MIKSALKALCALAIAASLSACISAPVPLTPKTVEQLRQQPPVRFLLSFDDGPSASTFYNPSITVLDSLADNPLQPNIKAVFFVQTGATGAGNSDQGRAIMHRQHAEGHLLGFHTATPHHTNHRSLTDEELEQSLTRAAPSSPRLRRADHVVAPARSGTTTSARSALTSVTTCMYY
ncbi:hypothetical protein GSU75_01508 [Pseudomonas savastanoi pv. phaseolicola]|nr:hypothetical protein [Pseudomonas savastanoi pv. phaseolicola]